MKVALVLFAWFSFTAAYAADAGSEQKASMLAAMEHQVLANNAMDGEDFATAQLEFSEAIKATPADPEIYKGRSQARFNLEDYPGVVADLDIYLAAKPDDVTSIMLRGLAYSLQEPEDAKGACADFLLAEQSGVDISRMNGVDEYCESQPGWDAR